jgi:hypothetical protein
LKTVKISIREQIPMKINCTGVNYEDTHKLSVKELLLFIERDLRCLSLENGQIFSLITVRLQENKFGQIPKIEVKVSGDDHAAYWALLEDLEGILWSYNKQIFYQNAGSLNKVYHRFDYQIHFEKNKSGQLEQAS